MADPGSLSFIRDGDGGPDREAIEAQIDRILASPQFRTSRRRCELLQWSVGRVLAGATATAKEYDIALDVFGKPESWDPRLDSSVRVEFNRMRQKLRQYYEGEGAADPVLIEFPFRGYMPQFSWRIAQPAPESPALMPVQNTKRLPLGRLFMAFGLVLLGIGAILMAHDHLFRRLPPVTTVAVLPFMDLTPGGQRQYLSDGFSEELTNSLAMLKGLRVVARTSAFQFKGKNIDVRDIGRELGAGAVVEGSILGQGDRIRVIVQLNRTADGTHIWQAQYDRGAKDILGIEDEIAQAVAVALRVRLEGPPASEFDPGPEALAEYMKGMGDEKKSDPDSLRSAEAHYRNAVRLAPRYARAYARLGSVHLGQSSIMGPKQMAGLENARQDFEMAVSLDPQLPIANAGLAAVKYLLTWDWPAAEAGFQRALALASTSATHQTYAWALMTRGRFVESERHYREAIGLDPLNCLLQYDLAKLLGIEGRAAAARQQIAACVEQQPDWFLGQWTMGYLEAFDNHPKEALRYLERAATLAHGAYAVEPFVVVAYAKSGRRGEALALMRKMEAVADQQPYARYDLALAAASLGDRDRLFYWLARSVDLHEQQALKMRVDPAFAPYQEDARMIDLERRVGLR